MRIAPAADHHVPGILAIYNEVIANSTAVYTSTPVTLEDRQNWLRTRQTAGFPVLVATDASDDSVVGFASFGDWRGAWAGYRYSVEHTVHVRADCRGQGIGKQLVEALFPLALTLRKHVLIGAIDADNRASLRFHARLGFEEVAHFKEVGHKFGRWLDLVFVQRLLDAPGAARDKASSLEIRTGDLTDPQVIELLRLHLLGMHESSPPGHCFALDLSGLQAPGISVFSAWRGEQLSGIGALKELDGAAGEIKSMRTHPASVRTGVGRALLDHIVATARARGYQRLWLETGSGAAFEPALSLYANAGFRECGPFGDYTKNEFNNLMVLEFD
jgi:L-amino acid N-acyltransferase